MSTRKNRVTKGSRSVEGKCGSRNPEGLERYSQTPSGISDVLIESDRGPRGPDDYTPIETLSDFSRKLGQIHQATVVLLTKQEMTEDRLGKIENRLEQGYECVQIRTLERHDEITNNLNDRVGQLALVDATTTSRVNALDDFVCKTRDERSKYTFWLVSAVVGLVLTAMGVDRFLSRGVEQVEVRSAQELPTNTERQIKLWCLTLTPAEKLRLLSSAKVENLPDECRLIE